MRRLLMCVLAGVLCGAPAGSLAPLDERVYAQVVAAAKGKVLLIDFWATWCEPCREEMPLLVRLEQKLKAKGLQLVTVSCDEPEDEERAAAFLKKSGVTGKAYRKRVKSDDGFIRWLEPQWSGALPALFVYDRSGKKVKFVAGEADVDRLEAEIRKLL